MQFAESRTDGFRQPVEFLRVFGVNNQTRISVEKIKEPGFVFLIFITGAGGQNKKNEK